MKNSQHRQLMKVWIQHRKAIIKEINQHVVWNQKEIQEFKMISKEW